MTKEAPELAESCETSCVTCMERRAVMMVYPCNHTALCRLCFVKMIKHVTQLSIIVIIINFLILITSKSVYFHRYSFFFISINRDWGLEPEYVEGTDHQMK